jgi:hypothetical protein
MKMNSLSTSKFRVVSFSTMVVSIVAIVAVTGWLLLWPMWEDYRIVKAFLRAVATKDSRLIEDEFDKLKQLHGTALGIGSLVTGLKGADSFAANAIARGFGKMGPSAEPAVPLLIEGLNENTDLSIRCLMALREMGPAAKAAVPVLLELRNGEHNPSIIRLQAAFALASVDTKVEDTHWDDKNLRALPEPVQSWSELTYVGSFRLSNPLDFGVVTMKLVRNREDDKPLIMNSANAKPTEIGDGRWEYSGQIEARCPPGTYDLVAAVGGTTQIGKTSVTVLQSEANGK